MKIPNTENNHYV